METTDAFSKVAQQSAAALKWSQLYDGTVSFPDPPTRASSTTYTSLLPLGSVVSGVPTGGALDSLGYNPRALANALDCPAGMGLRTEFIIVGGAPPTGDVAAGDATDVPPVFTRTLVANDMIGGRGNKVVIEQLKRTPAEWNSSTPQCWAMIGYRWNKTNPLPPLCYQFTVKMPSNMSDILTHTSPSLYPAWFEGFFLKDNDDNALMYHRLALVYEKSAGDTGMRFVVRFDLFRRDLSNNVISNDTPTALWRMESAEGSLEDGKQYTVYLYFDQKLDYTDLTGVTSVLIVNDTDKTVAMSDSVTGVPTCGYANTPAARIALHGLYTGGFPSFGTIQIEYGNTFVWDAPPIAMPSPRIGTLI